MPSNAVVVWNTVQMTPIIDQPRPAETHGKASRI
jgi:hypothetical protein